LLSLLVYLAIKREVWLSSECMLYGGWW